MGAWVPGACPRLPAWWPHPRPPRGEAPQGDGRRGRQGGVWGWPGAENLSNLLLVGVVFCDKGRGGWDEERGTWGLTGACGFGNLPGCSRKRPAREAGFGHIHDGGSGNLHGQDLEGLPQPPRRAPPAPQAHPLCLHPRGPDVGSPPFAWVDSDLGTLSVDQQESHEDGDRPLGKHWAQRSGGNSG